MVHKVGANIGGIDSIERLRLRCVCNAETGCWSVRNADGKRQAREKRQVVWVHGVGPMSAPRAAWMLHTGKPVHPRYVVYRRCDSYDCVNPEHLKAGPRRESIQFNVKRGAFDTAARKAAAREIGRRNARLTPELRVWLVESPQSGVEVAHALDVSQSRVNVLRAEARKRALVGASSIFAVGQAMNASAMRRRA